MSLLRFAALVLLAIWIGGLAVLGGIGAPAIFAVLEAHDPVGGRTFAGLLFGVIFDRFQHLAWLLGALLLVVLGARAALGPRPRRFAWRVWTVIVMLAMSLATSLILAPRIQQISDSVTGAVAALPDTDARKIEFGRLHATSTALMVVTLLAGLGLTWAEVKDR
jgi:Domain of unknown function (DUF4149)